MHSINLSYLIPEEIHSERLTLRTFKDADWKDLHHYYSDMECTRYTIVRTLTEGETWRTMAGMIGHWVIRGFGPYALEEKQSGRVIGISGLWYPNDWPEPEIKWGLVKSCQGKGFASEAALRIKQMAKEYMPQTPLISLIHGENKASIKLATTLGCHFEKSIEFRGSNWSIYRHHL